ncbi:MAG: MoaD/ThiS family protein [Gammaproteobacteria bacterium]|nr:MoaD/ThiS family protein [Gammaproteobacteria bacterium]
MMKVHFTPALKRFVPDLKSIEIQGATIADVITNIEDVYPGLTDYLVEENGSLRKHVNIFVNDTFIRDRKTLSDTVHPRDEVFIIQALSGG